MDVAWCSPDGSSPTYPRAAPAACSGGRPRPPSVPWQARPTCPTSADGTYQNRMAAVPSNESRRAPHDDAGHVIKCRRNARSCCSARQMLKSATSGRKSFFFQQLRSTLLFPFQAYSLPFQAEQPFKNSQGSTHTCPAPEGRGVTEVEPRHRISIPYTDLSWPPAATAESRPPTLHRRLSRGPPPLGNPTP